MNFTFDETSRMIIDTAVRVIEDEIRPEAARLGEQMLPPDEIRRLLSLLRPYGFLGALIPEADGGAGLDFVTVIRLYEELFRVFPGLAGTAFVNQAVGHAIWRDGTPSQKARWLPGLLDGTVIGSQAASEPEAGSHPRAIRLRAEKVDAGYRLNGIKTWISNGYVADLCIVLARMEDGSLSRLIVEREREGFTRREIPLIGQESWSTGELTFRDVFVPDGNLLGAQGSGNEQVLEDFAIARCFVSSMGVGLARAAFDLAVEYAKLRRQWGKPIGAHQLVQELVADMAMDIEIGQLLTYKAAEAVQSGRTGGTEASRAKLFTSEAAIRVTSSAIQVHGAMGLTRELPLESLFRDARMMTIPDGTSQLQKLIIARDVLGIAAFGNYHDAVT